MSTWAIILFAAAAFCALMGRKWAMAFMFAALAVASLSLAVNDYV